MSNLLNSVEHPGPDITYSNAWKYIWVYPNLVFKKVLTAYHQKHVIFFFALAGLSFDYPIAKIAENTSANFSSTLILAIAGTLILSYLAGELLAGVLYLVGKLLKGKCTFREIRTALAWSCIPLVVAAILSTGDIAVIVQNAVKNDVLIESPFISTILPILNILQFLLGLWTVVLIVIGIKTAQRFSFLITILNMVPIVFVAIFIALTFRF